MSTFDGLPDRPSIRQAYDHLVDTGRLAPDTAQRRVIAALDKLVEEIASRRLATKSSALGWLFAKKARPRDPIRGVYLHGGVGRGKTMLMDLFFEAVPVKRKRRVHFNAFMADVHDRIQAHRDLLKRGETKETDPIPPVVRSIASESWVICFDEFAVTDIADAMVLSRLFSGLFAEGIVLVATSNVAPRDLYRDGLNRGLFEPFITVLEQHARVMPLDGPTDYRQEMLGRRPVYLTPCDGDTRAAMDEAWNLATAGHEARETTITVQGRQVRVPLANRTAARFGFADICGAALGARDYLAIADRYDTIFIDCVPVMDESRRNEAKRFILLIDTLYDRRRRLFVSAEDEPDALYVGKRGTEAFEFARTASRLSEMRGSDWPENGDGRTPTG